MPASAGIRDLPVSEGTFDEVRLTKKQLYVHGWMLARAAGFGAIRVHWDGLGVAEATRTRRPELAQLFPDVRDAAESGFRVTLPVSSAGRGRLDLVGLRDGRPAARLSLRLFGLAEMMRELPPSKLMRRVAGIEGPPFRARALRSATDVLDALERVAAPPSGRLLDWGCGCGAVSAMMIAHGAYAVEACDIDAEAIAWCREHLAGARFTQVSPGPPTPYPEASFDVVIGCSVFTHLSHGDQDKWLREIRRILKPGGLLLASTHGAGLFARYLGPWPPLWEQRRDYLRKKLAFQVRGIYDGQLDPVLDGIAPPGYYRAVFQSRRHVRRTWSKALRFVEHVDRGFGGFQDLVIMRR